MHATDSHTFLRATLTPALFLKERRTRRSGFSLTELMVVIAIIVLLVGLLLVALKHVNIRAKRTRTESLMQQFANACASFQSEFGRYPGIIPEDVLAFTESNGTASPLTSTENALLELMGGFRVLAPTDDPTGASATAYANYAAQATTDMAKVELTFDTPAGGQWHLVINKRRIGEGPMVNGKLHASYFTPGANDLAVVEGQVGDSGIVDLIDAWGQPIIYLRQARGRGPLIADPASTQQPQFILAGLGGYLHNAAPYNTGAEPGLGEMGMLQKQNGSNQGGSILSVGSSDDQNKAFAAIISHPSFYKGNDPLHGAARGAIVLISAGPDGIFFSATDGPGSSSDPIDTSPEMNTKIINVGPRVIDEFNDIRVFSGG